MANMALMQMLAQLGATNPQLLSTIAASAGMEPPEPGALPPVPVGPTAMPEPGALPPVGAPPQQVLQPSVPQGGPMDFASALTGIQSPTTLAGMGGGGRPMVSAPGAPGVRQGQFNPQALAIMQALMQPTTQPSGVRIGDLMMR